MSGDLGVVGRMTPGQRGLIRAPIVIHRAPVIAQDVEIVNGDLVVKTDSVGQSDEWHIERIVAQTDHSAATDLKVYLGSESAINLIDAIDSNGNLAIAEYPNPILIPSNQHLRFVWSDPAGAIPANTVATVRMQVAITRAFSMAVGR